MSRGFWLLFVACGAPESVIPSETADSADPTDPPIVIEVDADQLTSHLDALYQIALDNEGHRSVGSSGYAASVDYVEQVLGDIGLMPAREPFELLSFIPESADLSFEIEVDLPDEGISIFQWSGSGEAWGPVQSVDLQIPPSPNPNTSTSGCESTDFGSFIAGSVALIQRGSCNFEDKAQLAQDAGAVAVVIFNEGQPDRSGVVEGTLASDTDVQIPVVGVSYDTGVALNALEGESLGVVVDATIDALPSDNVLVTITGEQTGRWIVGGHLDSVPAGPGINDNGTGVASVLELARWLAEQDAPPAHDVTFAFWGAEEVGLVGSSRHVDNLEDDANILGYLNFDMVGSPNAGNYVYEPDAYSPDGSDDIAAVFSAWFEAAGVPWAMTDLGDRSDHAGFIEAGIPAGGLFTGASEPMSASMAKLFDGASGSPHDPCYHQFCDTPDNVDEDALVVNFAAARHALDVLAVRPTGDQRAVSTPPGVLLTPERHHGCGGHIPTR